MDSVRILLVEDSAIDADLVQSYLDKCPYPCELTRVETQQEYVDALDTTAWNLILSDFALPDFDGMSALEIAKDRVPQTPFVFVSGYLGEEVAIDTLTKGATDYVLKKNLARLPAAVDRALLLSKERSERRLAQMALQKAKEAAEAANRAKDQFLAVLSHELRTPLTPILSTVQLWKAQGSIPPHLRDGIEVIHRNVQLEARLIDDLLDLTRIVRGKLQLNREPLDVHTLLMHVVEICRSDLDCKCLKLQVQFEASASMMTGDPARLQQVFWNLLKNAIKFTPNQGQVTIRTSDGPGDQIVIDVVDTGVGISRDALPRIFEAFEQGPHSRQFGGLGLGLAIAKALVERHGGQLHASSDGADRGAKFSVTLPVEESVGLQNSADPLGSAAVDGRSGMQILLVEDHADTANMMRKLLKLLGHHVQIASSVREAVEALQAQRFDLLISDIGLPDGSGTDVIACPEAGDIPGIAITGFGMDLDIRRSHDAGFRAHLTKPIDFKKLEVLIHALTSPQHQPAQRDSNRA